MVQAILGWVPRLGAFAAGLALVVGAGAPSGRADDEKPAAKQKGDEKTPDARPENPLQAELLKLNTVTGDEAQRARLLQMVKDKEKGKKLVAEAARMMKAAPAKDKPFNFNACLVIGRAAHFLKEYDAAEVFLEQCVELATKLNSGGKMLQAYEGLIDMYWDAKRFQSVIDVCERVVDAEGPKELEDAKPFILERLIQAKAKAGDTKDALRMAEGLIQLTDSGWYFIQLKGWVLREAGRFDDAITAYTESLNKLDTAKGLEKDVRDRMKDRTRYILSGLYVDAKQVDKAAAQLQTLVKRHPDNPTYKNDLGFIWCDHDMNLEESEKLIREALELDRKEKEKLKAEGKIDEVKESAAYLDSMGWVLYKQKKYKEALPYLQKAAADEEDGNHLEIWDHLGDCHMALGQTREAVAAWEKGLKMEDLSKRDAERRRKVTEKLRKARAELKGDGA